MSMASNQQEEQRQPLKIDLEQHLAFGSIASTKFLPSNELAKAVSDLFHGVFADFEGCIFEMPQNGSPYFSLVFNHGEYDEDAIVACRRKGAIKNQNDVVSRMRYRDAQLQNGDKYFITDDGKDVIKPLLIPRAFNNNNPNWKTIVGEYSEGRQGLYGYNAPQYTKVSFIDPDRICSLLYGEEIDGDRVEYHTSIFAPLTSIPGQMTSNYMLSIIRVSSKEITAVYDKFGLGSYSRIIK